jgi:hypothetical protein
MYCRGAVLAFAFVLAVSLVMAQGAGPVIRQASGFYSQQDDSGREDRHIEG